jgi:hypothetical protein
MPRTIADIIGLNAVKPGVCRNPESTPAIKVKVA